MFVEYMIIHLFRVSTILNHTLLVHIGIQPRFGGVGSWDSLMVPQGKIIIKGTRWCPSSLAKLVYKSNI